MSSRNEQPVSLPAWTPVAGGGELDAWAVACLERADDLAAVARLVAVVVTALRAVPDEQFARSVRTQLAHGMFDPDAFKAAVDRWYDRRIANADAARGRFANSDRARAAEVAERVSLRAWKVSADADLVRDRYFRAEDVMTDCNVRRQALRVDRRLGRAERAYALAVVELELAFAANETAALWGTELDGGRGLLDPRPYTAPLRARGSELWGSLKSLVRRR